MHTLQIALSELETLGTAQNRKIYKNHGAREPLFGVSFANFNKLKKKIKTDHALALSLWQTKNFDAMLLATMIADPKQAKDDLLDAWSQDLYCSALADLFSTYVYQTLLAKDKLKLWIKSENEWISRTGWDLVTKFAIQDKALADDFFKPFVETIRTTIHSEKNFTKHAMNNTLIAIGLRNASLKKLAVAAAKEIGKVEVDHKQTNCKTPDAIAYINKAKPRRSVC